MVDGLDHPWDVQPLGDGRLMLTQRNRASVSIVDGDALTEIGFPSDEVWVSGETGLMGLEVDPDFATSGRFHTCQGATTDSGNDVRVITWRLDQASNTATRERVLINGFPTSSGRHGGCRLLIATDGSMYVGTGDAAQGTNPQDLTSLGGKVLRLDPATGEPWPDNPFVTAENAAQRYVHSYGHRNVQGLAERVDGTIWSVEHGSFRDDEVNRLVPGENYGWNPVPGYNEQVPMTDQDLPGSQIEAAWRSGESTIAPGGGTFITGAQWGDLNGALAMAVLKDQQVLMLTFDATGALTGTVAPQELQGLGRVRTVVQDIGGDLLVTTDNGDGEDVLYRVRPA